MTKADFLKTYDTIQYATYKECTLNKCDFEKKRFSPCKLITKEESLPGTTFYQDKVYHNKVYQRRVSSKDISPPFPVYFDFGYNENNAFIGFVCNNETFYKLFPSGDIGYTLNEKSITARWNKTIYELYKNKMSKKYKTYLEPFKEWFDDREIDIVQVDSLIDEQPKENTKVSKKAKIQNVITKKHPKAKWEDVLFIFPAENETITGNSKIGLKHRGNEKYKYFNFREIGLVKKNGEPKRDWIVFNAFVLKTTGPINANETKQKSYITKWRTLLKNLTGINDDPFLPYKNIAAWTPKFRFKKVVEKDYQEYNDELNY